MLPSLCHAAVRDQRPHAHSVCPRGEAVARLLVIGRLHGAGYIARWTSRHVTITTLLSFNACLNSALVSTS